MSLSSTTFCSMSTELRAVLQLSCSSNLCLQQAADLRSPFNPSSFRSCCPSTGSDSAPGQLVRPPFSRFQWYKACQPLVSQLWLRRSFASGMLPFRLPVLNSAGRIDMPPCFGTYDNSRVHITMQSSLHGIQASISALLISFR